MARVFVGSRGRFAAALAALFVVTMLAYVPPLVTRAAIDTLSAAIGQSTPDAHNVSPFWTRVLSVVDESLPAQLVTAGALVAVLTALRSGFAWLNGRWASQASEGAIRRLRLRLFDHLQRLPCRHHDLAEPGDLVQRASSDVETVRIFLATQAVEIGRASLLFISVVPIMLALDATMAAVALTGAPIILGFGVLFFRRVSPAFLAMDEAEGRMTTVLQENLDSIRAVRAFARQEYEKEKFNSASEGYRNRHLHIIHLLAIYWPLSDVLVFAQQAAVLLTGAYRVAHGQMSVGTLAAFLAFVNIYIWPLRQMGRILADLGKALVAVGRIEQVLAEPIESSLSVRNDDGENENGKAAPQPLSGEIAFEHLTFQYGEGPPVLSDVSFTVAPGQTVAIVGPSGSGKSTLISLLLRFYDGFQGAIRLDGFPIDTLPRQFVRSQISVVMQEPFLYSKTVRENIILSRREAPEQELYEAAQMAAVHESITAFDRGYETLVGERGVTLSGGQRQRIALARALLARPAILALDDALSAVDTETESLILQALRQRHGRQTTLVIAHRLSTLQWADYVLVLDRGQVRQWGPPHVLRQQEGLYRRLALMQEAG